MIPEFTCRCARQRAGTRPPGIGDKVLFRGQQGFTILETAIAATVVIGISAAAFGVLNKFESDQKNNASAVGLMGIRTTVSKALSSEEAMKNLMQSAQAGGNPVNVASLGCVVNKTDCRSASGNIILYDKGTSPRPIIGVASPTNPNEGLTVDGRVCDTYNVPGKRDKCPFRYEVTWRPICRPLPEPCTGPTIELTATLLYNPDTPNTPAARVNPSRFRLQYVRQERNDKLSDTCVSLGGTPVSPSECRTNFGDACPAGQFIVGFEDNGFRICEPFRAFQCPPGQVLLAMNEEGSYACGTGCASNGSYTGGWFGDATTTTTGSPFGGTSTTSGGDGGDGGDGDGDGDGG